MHSWLGRATSQPCCCCFLGGRIAKGPCLLALSALLSRRLLCLWSFIKTRSY